MKMQIAIIGSGISGLGAAYLLNEKHEITVYEKNNYIGGHGRTVNVEIDGNSIPVDTGFIVFNYRNYPNLTGLFKQINVPVAKSEMSFGVSINNGWLEYGTKKIFNLFAQKRNLLRHDFLKMLVDILKFNKSAMQYIESDISLGELLDKLKMGDWFRQYYLLPMGACIWSTPLEGMLEFPARTFIRFFDNHGLLTIADQPQWYTVQGGSKEYIKRLIAPLENKIKLGCEITKVIRKNGHVEVVDKEGKINKYDKVILACHSDQALAMLGKPTKDESEILGAIKYQRNEMILHSDESFMQKRTNSWSSWVYLSETRQDRSKALSLSYWMNNLQPLGTDVPIIVTLNPGRSPAPEKIYDRYIFHHPVFDKKAIEAQSRIDQIQGRDGIWYTGAWQRYGFHEDGLQSAVNVAKALGADIPWK